MTNREAWKPIVDRQAAARCAKRIMGRPWLFLGRALSSFRRNQGLLLSGAVAYYTLLSIVPLMALVLVGLSHVLDQKDLLESVVAHLELLLPREAAAITAQITAFLGQRHVVGWTGMVVLVFFSTVAFSVLESAMSVIFYHRVEHQKRHFLVSLLIPFGFVLLVGASVFLVTFISGAVHALDEHGVRVFGYTWQMGTVTGVALYLLGVLGLILLDDGPVPSAAGRPYRAPPRPCRWSRGRLAVGDRASHPGLVLLDAVAGQCHLRLAGDCRGRPPELRDRGHDLPVRGPGDRRVRAVQPG